MIHNLSVLKTYFLEIFIIFFPSAIIRLLCFVSNSESVNDHDVSSRGRVEFGLDQLRILKGKICSFREHFRLPIALYHFAETANAVYA